MQGGWCPVISSVRRGRRGASPSGFVVMGVTAAAEDMSGSKWGGGAAGDRYVWFVHVCAQPCLTLCDFMDQRSRQASLSTEFSRPEYWSGLPLGDLPNVGMEPASLEPLALAGRFFTTAPPEKPDAFEDSPKYLTGSLKGI